MISWLRLFTDKTILRDRWPLIVFLFVILLSFAPIIFGGKTLTSSSQVAGVLGDETYTQSPTSGKHQLDAGASGWQDEPLTEKTSLIYRNADLPLWNAGAGLGKPLAAEMISAVFYPLKTLLFFSSSPVMWDVYLLLRIAISLGLTFVFLRLIGLEKVSAVVGATVYGLGGYFMLYIAQGHLNVEIIFPLILIAVEQIVRGKKNAWALLASAVLLLVTGGHPGTGLLIFTFALFYFLWRILTERAGAKRALGQFLGGSLAGVGLSMFLILPFLEFYRYAYTLRTTTDVATSHDPWQMFINQFYPYFFGWPWSPWTGQWGPGSGTRMYVGITALYLIGVAALSWRRFARYTPFFLVILVVLATKMYGLLDYSFIRELPFYNAIVFQKYIAPLVTMSVAVLSALGVNYLLVERSWSSRFVVVLPAALVALTLVFLYATVEYIPLQYRNLVLVQLVLPVALLGGSAIWLIWWGKSIFDKRALGWLLALICVLELVIWVPKIWPTRADPFKAQPYITYLQQDRYNRVFGFDNVLYPNNASAFNLYDIRDLDAAFVNHYFRYVREFINKGAFDRYTGNIGDNDQTITHDNPFFDATNITYVLTKERQLSEVSGQYQLVYDNEVRIYKNTRAFPRAYLITDVRTAATDESVVEEMRRPEFNPRTSAVIKGELWPEAPSEKQPVAFEAVRLQEYKDMLARFEVTAPQSSLLVLSDTYYPGWNAYVDGVRTPIYQTNLAFRGVPLSGGSHIVEFRYEPSQFRLGVLLSVITLLVMGCLLWGKRIRSWLGLSKPGTTRQNTVK